MGCDCEHCCMLTFDVSYILHVRFRSRSSPQSSAFRVTVKNHVVFLCECNKILSLRSRAEPLDCLKAVLK